MIDSLATRSVLRGAAPVALVLAGSIWLERAYGVSVVDSGAYTAYEFGYVVVPGWLVYRALSRRPGRPLRQLALGWALGYALEIGAFLVTAGTGTRGLFFAYPLVVGLPALALIVRRRPGSELAGDTAGSSPRLAWLVAAVCLVGVLYVGLVTFQAPLPGTETVHYNPDIPWHIALAADAKHHWPIEDANVSGEPLPYHYFVHLHMAAASGVTHVELPVIFLRLYAAPLLVLFVLLLVVAGETFARSAYVGLGAACLTLLIGEVVLDFSTPVSSVFPFLGLFFAYVTSSPSFVYGLIMLTALIILVGERITDDRGRGAPGDWVIFTLFAFGASNAKVTILPLLLGALVVFAAWKLLTGRRVPVAVWASGALLLVMAAVTYIALYRGHSSGMVFDPERSVHFFTDMPAVSVMKSELNRWLSGVPGSRVVVSAAGVAVGAFGLFGAQLVGLVWIWRRPRHRLTDGQVWLLSIFAVGLLVALTFRSEGTANEFYFVSDGLVAACLLSAQGLRIAWASRPSSAQGATRIAALGLAWLVVLVGLMVAPTTLELFTGANSVARNYLFWYGGLFASLVFLYAAARRWVGDTPWAALALVTAAVLVVGAMDIPGNKLEPALSSVQPPQHGQRMTPSLYRALAWIRDRTPADSVIAVNNREALEFDYAAFSERRVFFGGWGYSLRIRESGYRSVAAGFFAGTAGAAGAQLFPERLLLNDAVFERGNAHALEVMIDRYGVRYLVIDTINGGPTAPTLRRLGRVTFSAPGVTVLAVN